MSIKPNDDGPHNAEGPRMPFPVRTIQAMWDDNRIRMSSWATRQGVKLP